MTAQTRRPKSAALITDGLRHGAGLAALRVLFADRNRFVQHTTRMITEQTEHRQAVIADALLRAHSVGLVERDITTAVPRLPYWRLTVTGCEFVRQIVGDDP